MTGCHAARMVSDMSQDATMEIRDTAAIVTGASRGLGRALAEALAAAGARVVLIARHAGPLDEVVAGIRGRGGIAHAIAADGADQGAVPRVAGRAPALGGPSRPA